MLAILGLTRNRHPFLSGLPNVSFPAILLIFVPALLFGSSYAMSRGREMVAWLMAIPFFVIATGAQVRHAAK
jgi:hypothetical protein